MARMKFPFPTQGPARKKKYGRAVTSPYRRWYGNALLGYVFGLAALAMWPVWTQEGAAPADAEPVSALPAETAAEESSEPGEPGAEQAPADPAEDMRFVVVCPIEGEIDEGMAVVVKRAAERAKDAEALLFVINTPGGRLDSAIDITTAIMSVDCPTMAFIEGMGAMSAGALISYSCDYLYIAEGSNIGASTPIMPGVETTEAMDEKSNSVVRAKYRALGEANGHEPLLGEAMVNRNIEVRAYQNDDGSYYFFRTDHLDDDSATTKRPDDLLDKILDAVSESDSGGEEIGELLRKILGAAAGSDIPNAPETEKDEQTEAVLNKYTEMVSPHGELLTMTAHEAVKFGLAESITTDVDDTLREQLLGSVRRLTITPTWDEALFAFLTSPTIAALLLVGGIGGIYVEVRTPGFGAPGIIGGVCLALFFGSHLVLGMASWIDIVLIIVGFLLLLAEIFLIPGFGIAGVLGIVFLIGGCYLALVKAPIPEYHWDFIRFEEAIYSLTVAFVSLIVFIVVSGIVLPYTPMGRRLILSEAQPLEAGYVAQDLVAAQQSIGLVGSASTPLRPAGRGRFGGKTFDVVTRGEFVDKGTPIEIIESSGNRYVVTEVKTKGTA